MNWYSQLTRLILNFYRENPAELRQLSALQSCRLSRWWGVLRIHCPSQDVAKAIAAHAGLLCEPISQLRLAREIKLIVNGNLITTIAVQQGLSQSPRYSDRLI